MKKEKIHKTFIRSPFSKPFSFALSVAFSSSALFLLFFIFSSNLFAQYGVPSNAIPLNRDYSLKFKHKDYDMTVYLKDSSIIKHRLILCIKPKPVFTQFIKNGQDTILPANTDSVKVAGIVGIPSGETWVWKKVSGKLNVYSRLPESGGLGQFAFLDKTDKSLDITPYSNEALQKAVSDDPEALKIAREYKQGISIRNVMLFGGPLLVLGAFFGASNLNKINTNLPLVVFSTGCTMFVASPIPYFWVRNKDKRAIYLYNSHPGSK